MAEFHHRFDESREIWGSTAKPLAEECSIDLSALEPQLVVAKNLVGQQNLQTMEEVYLVLSSMQTAFPDLFIVFVLLWQFQSAVQALNARFQHWNVLKLIYGPQCVKIA